MEDVNLTNAAGTHGSDWQAVAHLILGRTKDQCRKRWAWMNACEQETDREFAAVYDRRLKQCLAYSKLEKKRSVEDTGSGD
jgi:hypothetical protein